MVAESLCLEDDGDELDLLQQLEATFNFKFEDEEITEQKNVGELYDLLLQKVDTINTKRKACHTAAAFRKLRHILAEDIEKKTISPSTELSALINSGYQIRPIFNNITEKTGLKLPLYGNDAYCFQSIHQV